MNCSVVGIYIYVPGTPTFISGAREVSFIVWALDSLTSGVSFAFHLTACLALRRANNSKELSASLVIRLWEPFTFGHASWAVLSVFKYVYLGVEDPHHFGSVNFHLTNVPRDADPHCLQKCLLSTCVPPSLYVYTWRQRKLSLTTAPTPIPNLVYVL